MHFQATRAQYRLLAEEILHMTADLEAQMLSATGVKRDCIMSTNAQIPQLMYKQNAMTRSVYNAKIEMQHKSETYK